MKTLFLVILICFSAHAETPTAPKSSGSMPVCTWPPDMGNSKFIASYWSCLERQEKFCEKNDKNKSCLALVKPLEYRKRFPPNTNDIDPKTRCAVQPDGSYLCQQDPIRFAIKEENIIPTSSAKPAEVETEAPAAPAAPATAPGGAPAAPAPAPAAPPPSNSY